MDEKYDSFVEHEFDYNLIAREDADMIQDFIADTNDIVSESHQNEYVIEMRKVAIQALQILAVDKQHLEAFSGLLSKKVNELTKENRNHLLISATSDSVLKSSHAVRKTQNYRAAEAKPSAQETAPQPDAPFVVGMVDKTALQEQQCIDSKVEVDGYNRMAKNTTKLAKEVNRLAGEIQAVCELRTEMEDITLCSDALRFLTDHVFRRVSATHPSDEWDTFVDFMDRIDTDKARLDALRSALTDLKIDIEDFNEVVRFQRGRNFLFHKLMRKPEALVTDVDSRQVGKVCASAKAIVLKYREIIVSAGRRRVL